MNRIYWNSIPLLRTFLIVANTACAIFWLIVVFKLKWFQIMPISPRGTEAATVFVGLSLLLVGILAGALGQKVVALVAAWSLVAGWCWGAYQLGTSTNVMQPPWLLAAAACGGLSVLFTAYALSVRRKGSQS